MYILARTRDLGPCFEFRTYLVVVEVTPDSVRNIVDLGFDKGRLQTMPMFVDYNLDIVPNVRFCGLVAGSSGPPSSLGSLFRDLENQEHPYHIVSELSEDIRFAAKNNGFPLSPKHIRFFGRSPSKFQLRAWFKNMNMGFETCRIQTNVIAYGIRRYYPVRDVQGYVETEGGICPFSDCESESLEKFPPRDEGFSCLSRQVRCEDCERGWEEVHELRGIRFEDEETTIYADEQDPGDPLSK